MIDDTFVTAKSVKRVLFCTGKIYYDLLQKQQDEQRKDVAIVRVEQLFPMPEKQMDDIRAKYKNAEFCWVQEEPENMGAWTYLLVVKRTIPCVLFPARPVPHQHRFCKSTCQRAVKNCKNRFREVISASPYMNKACF